MNTASNGAASKTVAVPSTLDTPYALARRPARVSTPSNE